MVARQRAALRSSFTLSRSVVLTDIRPDRSAPNRGMDSRRQTRRAISTSDAQIHLEPDPAGSLIDAIPPEAVILSAGEGSHINWWSTLIDLCAARFAGGLPHPESVQGSG